MCVAPLQHSIKKTNTSLQYRVKICVVFTTKNDLK